MVEEVKKPTEDDYAMMLKRFLYATKSDEKYKRVGEQASDLLKRGNKFQILRLNGEG